ncbi:MAG: hypothetical protein LC792_09320 [Actinobacteria bacterium]|nr:hypothetical protein [Actinomycetota bacterium]
MTGPGPPETLTINSAAIPRGRLNTLDDLDGQATAITNSAAHALNNVGNVVGLQRRRNVSGLPSCGNSEAARQLRTEERMRGAPY